MVAVVTISMLHALRDQPHSDASSVTLAPPASTADVIPLTVNKLVTWSEEERPGRTTYEVESLKLTFSSTPGSKAPVLEISGEGYPSARFVGEEGFGLASAEFGVGRIDPAVKTPQIVFNSYSGGAHCCVSIRLIELVDGKWRSVDVDTQDGDALGEFPVDVDGDGVRDFSVWDDRFLYAFASHAESYTPPRFLNVRNGQVMDVSAKVGFGTKFTEFLTSTQEQCEQEHNNGACAAFVAAAARAGKLDWAWPIMLAGYNRSSDWILPTACRDPALEGNCPEGATIAFDTYPEALQWFLGDGGYTTAVYVPRVAGEGPSFTCSPGQSEALQLVCVTPELAKADRELALLYSKAMALSAERAEVRDAERQFIEARNAAPGDVFVLLRMYQARLEALHATVGG